MTCAQPEVATPASPPLPRRPDPPLLRLPRRRGVLAKDCPGRASLREARCGGFRRRLRRTDGVADGFGPEYGRCEGLCRGLQRGGRPPLSVLPSACCLLGPTGGLGALTEKNASSVGFGRPRAFLTLNSTDLSTALIFSPRHILPK